MSLDKEFSMLYFPAEGAPVAGRIYEFGEFRLDCGRFELLRNGHSLKLERKPMELLILLTASNGQLVTRDEIAKHLWDSEVFVDTEHGINTAIRKIRQTLRDDSEEPRYVQTVTGMGYRFVAPLSAVESPVGAEPSPPPVAEPADAATAGAPGLSPVKSEPETLPSKPLSVRLAIATGYLALTAFFVLVAVGVRPLEDRLLHRGVQPAITSIAVFPLDNLSGDPGQEYFADGMTDELTTMLAKNSTLRITSRTSAMQYKGVHKPLTEIARALKVDGIVEGSVSRSGGTVHMTLQLIRADTDTHLWAESYDRDPNDVAALPAEAARDIAGHLHSSVPSSAAARYVNPEAHDAYLQGRYLWFRGRNDEAGKYFKKAVDLQPDYALGWAGLSNYYGLGAADGRVSPTEALTQAEVDAQKAVDLDNQLAEAHLSLGFTILIREWDFSRSLEEILRAIELDPRLVQAIHARARILSILGRHQEAIQAQKTATDIDPFERPWAMVTILDEAREYDAALGEAHRQLQADPQLDLGDLVAVAYRGKGMWKEWAQAYERQLQLEGDPASAAEIERAFRQGGQRAVVHWELTQLERKSKTGYVSPVHLALLYAELGDREKTLALLEQGFREHSALLLWIQLDPAYDFIHADPRYRSLIQRIGLPPAY